MYPASAQLVSGPNSSPDRGAGGSPTTGSSAAVPGGAGPGSGSGNAWVGPGGPPPVISRPTSAPSEDQIRSATMPMCSPSGLVPDADALHARRSMPSGLGSDTGTGSRSEAPGGGAVSYHAQTPLPGSGAPSWWAWYDRPSQMTKGSPSTASTERPER